jgi:hypothetical protein
MMEKLTDCKYKWCKYNYDGICTVPACLATTKELIEFKQYLEDDNERRHIDYIRKSSSVN